MQHRGLSAPVQRYAEQVFAKYSAKLEVMYSQKRGIINKKRDEKKYLMYPGQKRVSQRNWDSVSYDIFRAYCICQKCTGCTLLSYST